MYVWFLPTLNAFLPSSRIRVKASFGNKRDQMVYAVIDRTRRGLFIQTLTPKAVQENHLGGPFRSKEDTDPLKIIPRIEHGKRCKSTSELPRYIMYICVYICIFVCVCARVSVCVRARLTSHKKQLVYAQAHVPTPTRKHTHIHANINLEHRHKHNT
jgi:hypothetical protein